MCEPGKPCRPEEDDNPAGDENTLGDSSFEFVKMDVKPMENREDHEAQVRLVQKKFSELDPQTVEGMIVIVLGRRTAEDPDPGVSVTLGGSTRDLAVMTEALMEGVVRRAANLAARAAAEDDE